MPRRPDIASAIERLGKYAAHDDWRAQRREHVERMMGGLLDRYELELEACLNEIAELGHVETMTGFLDEAFLAAEFGADKVNVVDDFLKRRGWQETPRAREYLQGLRTTGASLYEVHAVVPGEWIELRDLHRGGPPQRIAEQSGSRSVQRWDRLVARVVAPRGETMLTGGAMTLTRESADALEGILTGARAKGRRAAETLARKRGVDLELVIDTDDTLLRIGDKTFFQIWLKGLLDLRRRPPPQLVNTDGEALLLSRTRLPVTRGVDDELVCRLDALIGWERAEPDTHSWVWQPGADEQNTVLATARLEDDALVVETNSHERMDRALAAIRSALATLVGDALTIHEDPMQILQHASPGGEPPLAGPEIEAALRRFTNAHYRRVLDEPVPMLGDKTPRECARTRSGRARVVRWLKDLENGELQRAAATGQPPYDFAWMWSELGVRAD